MKRVTSKILTKIPTKYRNRINTNHNPIYLWNCRFLFYYESEFS